MGFEFITNNKERIKAEAEAKCVRALEMCGMTAENYAKIECPVDTGNLRNSITHKAVTEGNEKAVYIGTNVEYAPYVELGTGSYYVGGSGIKGQRPQPYLKPAIANHVSEYQQILKDQFSGS